MTMKKVDSDEIKDLAGDSDVFRFDPLLNSALNQRHFKFYQSKLARRLPEVIF